MSKCQGVGADHVSSDGRRAGGVDGSFRKTYSGDNSGILIVEVCGWHKDGWFNIA